MAARISETFSLDPVVVLEATETEWLIRMVAHNIVMEERHRRGATNAEG